MERISLTPRRTLSYRIAESGALRIAFWLFIYAASAILVAYLLGAIWGAGNETMSLGGGTAHGSAFQEGTIRLMAYSSVPTGLISFTLILWSLRSKNVIAGTSASHVGQVSLVTARQMVTREC